MKPPLRIAILGDKFMGRAHSNAWSQAGRFFALPYQPVLQVACGRDPASLAEFAHQWGWQHTETDWRRAVARDDVDVVDIALPQHLHHDAAVAAARAGKHIFCEKPMALSVAEAEGMLQAATAAGVRHFLNHNYRRCPAVRLARKIIEEGRLGRIFHWRGAYQQDWIVDPAFPLTWHLRADMAGSGPHGDLNSHSVDLAHYLVGDISTVSCLTTGFIRERPLPGKGAATFSSGNLPTKLETGKVTVEDASIMNVEFANGAIGSFEASRFATGRKNHHTFEIYGSEGSLLFDLERMNELQFFSRQDPPHMQGFRTILVTESCHEYIQQWWPPGHIIGYEHSFVHGMADFVQAVADGSPLAPDFSDGLKCIKVLAAGLNSAQSGRRVRLSDPEPDSTPAA